MYTRGKISGDCYIPSRKPGYGKPKKEEEDEGFIKRKEMEIK
jgi:hypothetical protein